MALVLICTRSQIPLLDLDKVPRRRSKENRAKTGKAIGCASQTDSDIDRNESLNLIDPTEHELEELSIRPRKYHKTLDDYCYECLDKDDLGIRNKNQVVRRYYRREHENVENHPGHDDEILVVSFLWIWRLGGL